MRAWDGMSSRDHRLAVVVAAIVAFALAWLWLWRPLQDDTQRARRDLLRDRSTLAAARAQATEILGLQRGAQSAPAGDPRLAVERVLNERALKSSLTSLDVKDSRLYVTFTAIGFEALIGTLDALAKGDGLRPVEATLTPRVEQGSVRAEIALAR
jgi:type II secretory pathway component PulM